MACPASAFIPSTRTRLVPRVRSALRANLLRSRGVRNKNGVGILVDRDLREQVIDVRRVKGTIIAIKLVVVGFNFNVVSSYAPQTGLDKEVKRHFWEDLDEVVRGILHIKKMLIGGDFNGHIRMASRGYDDMDEDVGFGDRNEGGTWLLDFGIAFDMVIANSSFQKKEEDLRPSKHNGEDSN
uniref:Craniofacial development protein 2-like n=1 Tax=Nicotiana tabacum TaxID=4097 RepID=A0A1S4C303_TOBAC|nr:PREDICTED: uncharacterized protein LOC107814580 [Nicotiana tabacum]